MFYPEFQIPSAQQVGPCQNDSSRPQSCRSSSHISFGNRKRASQRTGPSDRHVGRAAGKVQADIWTSGVGKAHARKVSGSMESINGILLDSKKINNSNFCSELHAALDQREFAGVLKFWRLRENGDVFVEEIENLNEPTTSAAPDPAPAPLPAPAPATIRAPIQQAQPVRLIQNQPIQEVQHVRVEPPSEELPVPFPMGRIASRSKDNTLNGKEMSEILGF